MRRAVPLAVMAASLLVTPNLGEVMASGAGPQSAGGYSREAPFDQATVEAGPECQAPSLWHHCERTAAADASSGDVRLGLSTTWASPPDSPERDDLRARAVFRADGMAAGPTGTRWTSRLLLRSGGATAGYSPGSGAGSAISVYMVVMRDGETVGVSYPEVFEAPFRYVGGASPSAVEVSVDLGPSGGEALYSVEVWVEASASAGGSGQLRIAPGDIRPVCVPNPFHPPSDDPHIACTPRVPVPLPAADVDHPAGSHASASLDATLERISVSPL